MENAHFDVPKPKLHWKVSLQEHHVSIVLWNFPMKSFNYRHVTVAQRTLSWKWNFQVFHRSDESDSAKWGSVTRADWIWQQCRKAQRRNVMISNLDKWMRISNEHEKQMEWVENSMLQKICFTRSKTFYDLPCFLISISPRLLIISVSLSELLLCVCICMKVKMLSTLGVYRNIFSHVLLPAKLRQLLLLKWRLRLLRKKFFAHTKSLAHSTANTRLLIFNIIPPLSPPHVPESEKLPEASSKFIRTSLHIVINHRIPFHGKNFLVLLKFTEIEFTLLQSNFQSTAVDIAARRKVSETLASARNEKLIPSIFLAYIEFSGLKRK